MWQMNGEKFVKVCLHFVKISLQFDDFLRNFNFAGLTFFSSKISLQFNDFLKNCSFFYPKLFGTHCASWWDFHVHWKIILNVTQILGHKRKKKYLASFPCVCVCNMTMIIRHDFLCLKISMVVLCAEQCVKILFFVQKLQILEKFEKWSILIFVSKLTIFSCKNSKFVLEFSRLKLVKNCHFMFFL